MANPSGRRTIAQFMWGYQYLFRSSLEFDAARTLDGIGFVGHGVQVLLVGFQVSGSRPFPICVEPERGPFHFDSLTGVSRRAEEIYHEDPESQMHHTAAHVHEARHRALQDRARADALCEALAATAPGLGRSFFASRSVLVGEYEVHAVLHLDSVALARVPRIQTTFRDRFKIHPSLVHAAISRILRGATLAMLQPDAGAGLNVLDARWQEIARSSGEAFVHSLLLCVDYWFGQDANALFDAISVLPYEGRPGSGRVILAAPSHPAVETLINFRQTVSLRDDRTVRKLVEASGPEADLVCDGDNVTGLGHVLSEAYDSTREDLFVVHIHNRGSWSVSHDGVNLMQVKDGLPELPALRLAYDQFVDVVSRTLPSADIAVLWKYVDALTESSHGAMLIVSEDAAAEADRLSPQCWSVQPVGVSSELISQISDMDGGVLVDPKGRVHAIGVIVDGVACGKGNPGRGSRFNNAVRYLDGEVPATVIVVFSSDGTTDLFPQLRPRVSKRALEELISRFLENSNTTEVDFEVTARLWEEIRDVRFYLDQAQCDALNAAHERLNQIRGQGGGIQVIEAPLTPDPEMNNSYWLDS